MKLLIRRPVKGEIATTHGYRQISPAAFAELAIILAELVGQEKGQPGEFPGRHAYLLTGEIRCQSIILAQKDEPTSRQEARERRIVGSLKPFRWNPAGNQSRPVEPDQQPEASLAWWLRYLHRHSDSYRLERPSCRVGIAPTKDPTPFHGTH